MLILLCLWLSWNSGLNSFACPLADQCEGLSRGFGTCFFYALFELLGWHVWYAHLVFLKDERILAEWWHCFYVWKCALNDWTGVCLLFKARQVAWCGAGSLPLQQSETHGLRCPDECWEAPRAIDTWTRLGQWENLWTFEWVLLWSNVLEHRPAEFATPFVLIDLFVFLFHWADTSMAMLQCSEHLSIEFIDNDSLSQDSKAIFRAWGRSPRSGKCIC